MVQNLFLSTIHENSKLNYKSFIKLVLNIFSCFNKLNSLINVLFLY